MPTSALHVARTGLEAQDTRMRVIANNLANIATTGYKRDRANFATLAYQDSRVAGQQSSNETAYATGLNLGTGVATQSTTPITTQVRGFMRVFLLRPLRARLSAAAPRGRTWA